MLELTHLFDHWDDVLAGAITWSIIGHAVNTFPEPTNIYLRWLLMTIRFAVGQRTPKPSEPKA